MGGPASLSGFPGAWGGVWQAKAKAGSVIQRQLLGTVRAKPGGRGLLMGPVTRRELWESLAHFTVSVSWRRAQKVGWEHFGSLPGCRGGLSIAVQLSNE